MRFPVMCFLRVGFIIVLMCIIDNQISALRIAIGTYSSKHVKALQATSDNEQYKYHMNSDSDVVENEVKTRLSKVSGLFDKSREHIKEKGKKQKNKFLKEAKLRHKSRQSNRLSKRLNRKYGIQTKNLNIKQKSCPTQTVFSRKPKAVDIFGDLVDVVPTITIGDHTVQQLFYEIYCHREKCSCGGIYKKAYHSTCESTHGFTFALVKKGGKTSWNYIKVRTGCQCVIQKREKKRTDIIYDLLHRDNKSA
ncbi:hypothetical protein ACF0H5_008250 [Mactra antiquata]